MPPRSRHLPTPTPSARWNVTSPRSPNRLSTSKPRQPRPNCNRYERMPHARSAEFQMNTSIIETNTACLLVVDDQESNISVVGAALGKLGFEILPATGGLQAFQRLAVRRPDLILLDLLMPEMDGFEVCRRIRANPDWAEIPIIFLSSADDKVLRRFLNICIPALCWMLVSRLGKR